MKEKREFLVPDYFSSFSCKMGDCRSACCVGWPITFSLTDYFKLLSLDCSPQLKRKIDISLHIAEHPTPEGYAQISPRYDGQCPMRMEDGRCALHAELGDEVLAAVCRLYPRGVRNDGVFECSCANSCEAVIELLLRKQEPIRFLKTQLSIDVPELPTRQYHFEDAGREEEIRLWLISFLQKRSYTLPQRLLWLGDALHLMSEALMTHNTSMIEGLLTGKTCPPVPVQIPVGRDQLCFGLDAAKHMLEILDERSNSIRAYGEEALSFLGSGEDAFRQYVSARDHFERRIPEWERWFEQMLVNHMFFVQFPFQDRPVDLNDEYLALCAVYALLRFLCIGWTAQHPAIDDAADVCAASFRLIDHTEFDRYAAPILKKMKCDQPEYLRDLLYL